MKTTEEKKIIRYADLDDLGRAHISMTLSERLERQMGQKVHAEALCQLLQQFQVSVQSRERGRARVVHDTYLEAAIRALSIIIRNMSRCRANCS